MSSRSPDNAHDFFVKIPLIAILPSKSAHDHDTRKRATIACSTQFCRRGKQQLMSLRAGAPTTGGKVFHPCSGLAICAIT